MAERRMLTRKVTDDDRFMMLSSSAQALYLHLSMNADDDGFCNQVYSQMFRAHATVEDLESLLYARFIYQFESGVIVIKDWRMANALRKDRYTETIFKRELSMLSIDENGAYTMNDGCQLVATWLPGGCQQVATCLPQDRIDNTSISNTSISNTISDSNTSVSNTVSNYNNLAPKNEKRKHFVKPTVEQVRAYEIERGYPVDKSQEFFDYYESCEWKVGRNKPMKDWKASVRYWHRNDPKPRQYAEFKSQREMEWLE